jgi:hypothetical protein
MEAKELAQQWLDAKQREREANAERIKIEEQIVAALGKRDEGAQSHKIDGFKITVTGKVTRKMDWDKWEVVKDQIPEALRPIKLKPELDERGVKYLKENKPDIYGLLPITVAPAKTGVDVTAEGE